MEPTDTPHLEAADEPDQRKILMLIGIGSVSLFFFIFDVLGLINGGGLFNILSAMVTMHSRAETVDVDSSGLFTAFLASVWSIVLLICFALKIGIINRATIVIVGLTIVVSSFVLSMKLGNTLIDDLFHSHGYVRCASRDHVAGHGKGQVWFHNYVHRPLECHPDRLDLTS